jgi:hypothetical protein
MDLEHGMTEPNRESLRQRLQDAFPRIHLEFNSESRKWFPKSGLHGSRFLGHAGLSDGQAFWLLENQGRVSEVDVLLERYPQATDDVSPDRHPA